jgi:hypothetical protein
MSMLRFVSGDLVKKNVIVPPNRELKRRINVHFFSGTVPTSKQPAGTALTNQKPAGFIAKLTGDIL